MAKLTQNDSDILDSISLVLGIKKTPVTIYFQFPPKITNDSRQAKWNEKDVATVEPNVIFASPGFREITLEWEYIAGFGGWTWRFIHSNLNYIRRFITTAPKDQNLVAKTKLYSIGGDEPFTCRIISFTTKYGNALVRDGKDVYPLSTKATLTLKVWAKRASANKKAEDKAAEESKSDEELTDKPKTLNQMLSNYTSGWY